MTDRRQFLRGITAGGAALTVSSVFAGCNSMLPTRPVESTAAVPVLEPFALNEDSLSRAISALSVNGADIADVYLHYRRRNTIRIDQGFVEVADADVTSGAGLRVVNDGRSSYAMIEEPSEETLLARSVELGSALPGAGLMLDAAPPGDLYRINRPWDEVGLEERIELARSVDERARRFDATVVNVTVHFTDSDEHVAIAALDGRLTTDRRPLTRLGVQLTAVRDGATQSGYAHMSAREGVSWYTDERIAELIDTAARRMANKFDARRPPLGDMPVVLAAGTSGALLHEAVGHAFEADLVQSGESPLAGLLGEVVAHPDVTIIDDATLPNARGALNVDDEGTRGSRQVLVEAGVLRGFLHDQETALRAGQATTGSGRRESWRFPPSPRMSCTYMASGPAERDEIIASVDKGLFVETFAGGNVSVGSGEFGFRVENGRMIEKGKLTAPVKDVTIAGNGHTLLQDVAMVANDSSMDPGGWTCGKQGQRVPVSVGMPTVLLSNLTVGDINS